MPGLTPNQSYPYPLDTELQDVAGDIENLAMAADEDIAGVLADVLNKVDRTGDTMSGMLTLPGTAPSSLNHAARKGYVDTQDELRVAVAGGSMSGDLAMGGNKVTGLGAPTASGDAARKSYVDDAIIDAVRTDLTSTQIMAGPLRSPRFTVTDPVPDNPDELTSKQYVDGVIAGANTAMNGIIRGNTNGDATTSGLLIQGAIAMVTLDIFAGAVITFPEAFLFAPVVLVSAANATQGIFVGAEASTVTTGQFVAYGKIISTGAAAIGGSVMFNWLAVGLAA